MASRAETSSAAGPALPREPALGAALRIALGDFYYNSPRLVAANLIWGASLVALWFAFLAAPPIALLATPLLAFPTAALFRIAGLVHRGEPVSFWDGLAVWRVDAVSVLLLGAALAGCMAVFLFNVSFGLLTGGPLGWALATFAAWGAVVTWLVAWTAWPILLDPARADRPVRERLRTAVLLVIAFPLRMGALGFVLAVVLFASTVAAVALVTIGVAFAALAATRYVLPAADRLEHRLGEVAIGPTTRP